MSIEANRIQFLIDRDGMQAAKEQVAAMLRIYHLAVLSPKHSASAKDNRGDFVDSMQDFAAFLEDARAREVLDLAEQVDPTQYLDSLRKHPSDKVARSSNELQAAQLRIRSMQHA